MYQAWEAIKINNCSKVQQTAVLKTGLDLLRNATNFCPTIEAFTQYGSKYLVSHARTEYLGFPNIKNY
jgi:hypothetical protein